MSKIKIFFGTVHLLQVKKPVSFSAGAIFHRLIGRKGPMKALWLLIFLMLMTHSILWGEVAEYVLGDFSHFPIHTTGRLDVSVGGVSTLYPGEISITAQGIKITCKSPIFAPANDYNAPRVNTLWIQPTDYPVVELYWNGIVIFTSSDFYEKYRHLFIKIGGGYVMGRGDKDGLFFKLDQPHCIEEQGIALIKKVLSRFFSPYVNCLTRAILILPVW